MATPSNILAWRIPWTDEPGRLESMGSQRVRHHWSDLAHTHGLSCHLVKMEMSFSKKKEKNILVDDGSTVYYNAVKE